MEIFHGGCYRCTMQDKHGLGYCVGCTFFEGDHKLPDLNDEHRREKEHMEMVRARARELANKKPPTL